MTEEKKDYSTAILEKKKAPNKLQVEDSTQDDNSIVELTQAKMDELKIFKGDAVILRGKYTYRFPTLVSHKQNVNQKMTQSVFVVLRKEEKGDCVHCFDQRGCRCQGQPDPHEQGRQTQLARAHW